MRGLVRPRAVVVLLTAAVGCGPEEPPSQETQPASASRSAGSAGTAAPRVVENPAPSWEEPWTIEDTPLLTIGVQAGAPEYELYRISDAYVLSDGRLVIGNGGTGELRWYSPSGEFIRSAGRPGDGPGEFRIVGTIVSAGGDSIAVGDVRLRRLTVFDPEGRLVRTIPHRDAELATPLARARDGSFLLRTSGIQSRGGPSRIERESMTIYRLEEGESRVDLVEVVPWMEMYIGPSGVIRSDGVPMVGQNRWPFGRDTYVAAHADGWVLADNAEPRLEYRSPTGAVRTVALWSGLQRPVTDADIARDRDWRLSRIEDTARRQRTADLMDERPRPSETMPWFGCEPPPGCGGNPLLTDVEGNVWLKEYAPPAEEDPQRYRVFDSSGSWLGVVRGPPGIFILRIGVDRVVGMTRDDLGVEVVAVHRLVRPGP